MQLETIRVTTRDNHRTYTVQAEEVHDFEVTDAGESVAWNGCARIMKDQKGNYYYGGFSGRGGDTWKYWLIDSGLAQKSIRENDIDIIAEYL